MRNMTSTVLEWDANPLENAIVKKFQKALIRFFNSDYSAEPKLNLFRNFIWQHRTEAFDPVFLSVAFPLMIEFIKTQPLSRKSFEEEGEYRLLLAVLIMIIRNYFLHPLDHRGKYANIENSLNGKTSFFRLKIMDGWEDLMERFEDNKSKFLQEALQDICILLPINSEEYVQVSGSMQNLASTSMKPHNEHVNEFCYNVALFYPTFDYNALQMIQHEKLLSSGPLDPDSDEDMIADQSSRGYVWPNNPQFKWIRTFRTALKKYFSEVPSGVEGSFAPACFRNVAWKHRNSHFFHPCVMSILTGFIFEDIMQTESHWGFPRVFPQLIRSYIYHAMPRFALLYRNTPDFEFLQTDSAKIYFALKCIPLENIRAQVHKCIHIQSKDYGFEEQKLINEYNVQFLTFAQVSSLSEIHDQNPGSEAEVNAYFDQLNLS